MQVRVRFYFSVETLRLYDFETWFSKVTVFWTYSWREISLKMVGHFLFVFISRVTHVTEINGKIVNLQANQYFIEFKFQVARTISLNNDGDTTKYEHRRPLPGGLYSFLCIQKGKSFLLFLPLISCEHVASSINKSTN